MTVSSFGRGLKFHQEVKSILGKMAADIRTLSVIAQKLPLMTRLALLERLVISNLNHSALLFTDLSEELYSTLEKQLHWGL